MCRREAPRRHLWQVRVLRERPLLLLRAAEAQRDSDRGLWTSREQPHSGERDSAGSLMEHHKMRGVTPPEARRRPRGRDGRGADDSIRLYK